MVSSSQETTDDHPHLDAVIAALGRVQNNGMDALNMKNICLFSLQYQGPFDQSYFFSLLYNLTKSQLCF